MKLERHVVISDLHAPFHDQKLCQKVCQFIYDIQPNGLVINGDFLDLYSLARFNADSVFLLKDITLEYEYKVANRVLSSLEEALPSHASKVFLYGNHEDRYQRELERGDRAKYGDALQSPTTALRLMERGWKVYENYKQDCHKLGAHLEVTHGVFITTHTAKKHLDEFQGSVLIGHTHRLNTYVNGRRGAWNVGFLGDMSSKGFHYLPRTTREKWTQSFAVVSVAPTGDFWVEVVQVHDGIFVYADKLY